MRFFLWVFTLIAAIVAAVYFSDLNPDPIMLRLSRQTSTEVTPLYLLLFCIAGGALAVVLLFGLREVRVLIINWRSTQRRKREEKLQSYYNSGVMASLSRRTSEAISQLQKLLALDPTNIRALLSLGNIFRREKHYNEAIRLHLRARSLEDGNLEILFSLARDLEDAKRYDEAIQALEDVLKHDSTNPTALYRIREIKLKQAAESWEKSYVKTGNPLFLQRLEDLYLELGEPGEMLRIYQVALSRNDQNPLLKLALGKLYYRLEMIDDAFDLLSTLEGLQDPTGALHKIMACLYIRKGDTESALIILQEALNRPRSVGAPFACTACHDEAQEWNGRCLACGRWNTLAHVLPSFGSAGQLRESVREPVQPQP